MEKKKVRQYRSRQGRSDKQYESSMKIMTYSITCCLIFLALYGIVKSVINVLG